MTNHFRRPSYSVQNRRGSRLGGTKAEVLPENVRLRDEYAGNRPSVIPPRGQPSLGDYKQRSGRGHGIDGKIYPLSSMPQKSGKAAGELDFMDVWFPLQVKQRDI